MTRLRTPPDPPGRSGWPSRSPWTVPGPARAAPVTVTTITPGLPVPECQWQVGFTLGFDSERTPAAAVPRCAGATGPACQ